MLSRQSTNTLMTASWYVVAKLLTVSRMSKVDYQNKVLPIFIWLNFACIALYVFF